MQKIRKIVDLLVRTYGHQKPEKNDPLDTLVAAILSQNTNDTNSGRAYDNLVKNFRIEEVPSINTNRLAKVIHSGGLPQTKAKRIKTAVKFWQDEGLGHRIGKMTDDEIRETLTQIDGVGPKTAEIVLIFGLGRQALPVDTHVWRVTRRLGLVPDKTSREKTAEILRKIVPYEMWADYHMNIIEHGRTVCTARSPKCRGCVLLKQCPFGKKTVKMRA